VKRKTNLVMIFFAVLTVLIRLLPLKLPNIELFSTFIAISILTYHKNVLFVILPILVLVSDILLFLFLKTPLYPMWEVVVIVGWLFVVIAQNLLKGKRLSNAIIMELSGSVVFYFVTNSLVFFFFNFYPKNFVGYISCMIAGLPFLRNQTIYNFFLAFVVYYTVNWLSLSYEKKEIQI
jgi:hypothetical protein